MISSTVNETLRDLAVICNFEPHSTSYLPAGFPSANSGRPTFRVALQIIVWKRLSSSTHRAGMKGIQKAKSRLSNNIFRIYMIYLHRDRYFSVFSFVFTFTRRDAREPKVLSREENLSSTSRPVRRPPMNQNTETLCESGEEKKRRAIFFSSFNFRYN